MTGSQRSGESLQPSASTRVAYETHLCACYKRKQSTCSGCSKHPNRFWSPASLMLSLLVISIFLVQRAWCLEAVISLRENSSVDIVYKGQTPEPNVIFYLHPQSQPFFVGEYFTVDQYTGEVRLCRPLPGWERAKSYRLYIVRRSGSGLESSTEISCYTVRTLIVNVIKTRNRAPLLVGQNGGNQKFIRKNTVSASTGVSLTWRGVVYDADCDFVAVKAAVPGLFMTTTRHGSCVSYLHLKATRPANVLALNVTVEISDSHHRLVRTLRLSRHEEEEAFTKVKHIHWQIAYRASAKDQTTQLPKPFTNATFTLKNKQVLFSVDKESGKLRFHQHHLDNVHNAPHIFILNVMVGGCHIQCTKQLFTVLVEMTIPDGKTLLPQTNDCFQPKVFTCCQNAAVAIVATNKRPVGMETFQVDDGGVVRLNSSLTEQTSMSLADMLSLHHLTRNEKPSTVRLEIVPCKQQATHPRRVVRNAVKIINSSSGISIAPFVLVSVPENTMAGTPLIQVPARITSTTTPGLLLFQITGGNADKLFTIDKNSGNITLAKTLDYEKSSLHQLAVTASVRNSLTRHATSHIHVKVVDVNEHTPVFTLPHGQSLYTKSIAENLKPGQRVLQLTATDRDDGSSGKIGFSITHGNKYATFSVNNDGELLLQKPLNYELASLYELVVVVYDNGWPVRQSEVNIQITVLNINDNAPVFIPATYYAVVKENSPAMGSILRVSTTDADSAQTARYQIVAGNTNGKFFIDSMSGVLGVLGALDREAQKEYCLIVSATDSGFPPLTANTTVTIAVSDVNDNPSSDGNQEIVINTYNGFFQAGPIGTIQAGDPDDDDKLECRLSNGRQPALNFFSVRNSDCVVSLLQSSTPAGTYQVAVDVRDGQHPWVKRQVQIKVISVPTAASSNSLTFRVQSSPAQLVERKTRLQLQYALQQTTHASAQNLYLLDVQSSGLANTADVSFAVATSSNTFVQQDRLLVDLSVNRTKFEQESRLKMYSLPVDPCASEPCKNLGTCQATWEAQPSANSTVSAQGVIFHSLHIGKSYHCVCRSGTTGSHCEYAVDACYSSPCQTGATCQSGPADSYTCLCADGTLDCNRQKPTSINPCQQSPCLNKGQCRVENSKAVCHCRSLFYGSLCQYSVFQPLNHCQSNPCGVVGTCTAGRDNYTCSCPVSYAGRWCQRRILPTDTACASNPCLYGAACTPQGSSYTCQCSQGFAGPRCSWPLNTCQEQPCQNGGSCVPGQFGTYICDCPAGYTGQNCSVVANPCLTQPCKNGGRCTQLAGVAGNAPAFSCSCDKPFYGITCQHSVFPTHCTSNPCAGGATCTAGVDGYSCACPPGRSGDRCERPSSSSTPCGSNPCLHNSKCVAQPGGVSFQCLCSPGFTGDRCQVNINECASKPCHGNSSCQDAVNGYLCECPQGMHGQLCQWPCPAGYSGHNCLSHLFQCQPGACLNGATCVESINTTTGYECRCPQFYTGSKCEQKLSCAEQPCLHGGTCRQKGSGYTCTCPVDHTGANCELTMISIKPGGYRLFHPLNLQTTGSIKVRFATLATNGLLFYNTQLQNGSSVDFVAVELSDGYVQAAFGLGGKSRIQLAVRTSVKLNDGQWHLVKVSHIGELGRLEVDGCIAGTVNFRDSTACHNTAVAHGSQRDLNLGLPFHLGGIGPADRSLVLNFPFQSLGFSGCLGEVIVDDVLLDLAGQFVEDKTAAGCPTDALINACSSQPCSTSATCVPLWSGYRCICPLGRTGEKCEKESSLLSFSGSGYIRYELVGQEVQEQRQRRSTLARALQRTRSTFSDTLQMTIRPSHSPSVERQLLWYMASSNGKEYASLQVVNNSLSFVFNLGGGTATATLQDTPVYDGKWHTLTVQRVGRLVTMNVDSQWHTNATSRGDEWLDVSPAIIYLAGLPTNISSPANSYHGYHGCVRDVQLDTNEIPLSGSNQFAKAYPSKTGTSDICMAGRCQDICHSPWECNHVSGQCECPSGECSQANVDSEDESMFTSWYLLYVVYPVAALLILSILLLSLRYKRRCKAKVTLKQKAALPPISPGKAPNNRSYVLPNQEPDGVILYSYEGGGESIGMMYSVDVLMQEANRAISAMSNQTDGTYSQQETEMTSLQSTQAPSTRPGSTSTNTNSFHLPRPGSFANPLDRVLFLERGGASGRSSAQSSHRSSKQSTPYGSNAVTPRGQTFTHQRGSPQPTQRVSPQGASHKATPIPSPRPSRRSSPPGEVSEHFSELTDERAAQQLHNRLYELNGDRCLATPDQRQVYSDEGRCHLDQLSDSIDSELHLQQYSKEPARLGDPRRIGPAFQQIAQLFQYDEQAERTTGTPRPLRENLV